MRPSRFHFLPTCKMHGLMAPAAVGPAGPDASSARPLRVLYRCGHPGCAETAERPATEDELTPDEALLLGGHDPGPATTA